MRAVYNLLREKDKLKHVNFSLCDSHSLQLLIKDVFYLSVFKDLNKDINNLLTFFS